MKALGYQVIDMIVDHMQDIPNKNPIAKAGRSEMDWLLHEPLPEEGMEATKVLDIVSKTILSNSALLNHPKFYSFVPSPSNYISVLADTLATGFNIFSGAWTSSPGAAELELLTINWLLKLVGFPIREGGGIFVSGGSMANLTALVTARHEKLGEDFGDACIYFSDQTHSSVDRALLIIGFKKSQFRKIPCDEQFRIPLDKLKKQIAADRADGKQPFCLIANAGTTNTGAVDPLYQLATLCRQEKLWMHVDAAYGGGALLARQSQKIMAGIELADSVTIDPHKWFYQPYEIGAVLVRNHEWLAGTFRMNPEYLRDVKGNAEEINFYDHGVQLTRRLRALKFYMSVKTYGLGTFRRAVENSLTLAEQVAEHLKSKSCWEIVAPPSLAVINFRLKPEGFPSDKLDELNQFVSDQIISSQQAMLATTIIHGKKVLRMCLINPATKLDDVMETITLLEGFGEVFEG